MSATVYERMLAAATAQAVTIACSMCTRPWQRPEGMVEKRCPSCARRRGTPYSSAGEQLAVDVTRYRLAIEEATQALRAGMVQAALRVLLTVEAPGQGVDGAIIGPSIDRQGNPDTPSTPEVASKAPVGVASPEILQPADDEDDPIALVQSLAAGAFRPRA
jgi:hypothetical protein